MLSVIYYQHRLLSVKLPNGLYIIQNESQTQKEHVSCHDDDDAA